MEISLKVDGRDHRIAVDLRTTLLDARYRTPGQIVSAVGMLAEAGAEWPSHVTSDIAAADMPLSVNPMGS